MNLILTVAAKEFRTFFQTPMGAVILFVSTLMTGWWFFSMQSFFDAREASLRGLFSFLPVMFLLYAPAVTMRLWAEEKKTGTFEVLMTLPMSPWQVVLGKFLAGVGLVAVFLLCQAPALGVVAWLGDPDPGPILGGFLGSLLLGAAYVSIGMAASALTENQIIALIAGVAGAFFFYLLGNPLVTALFPGFLGSFLHQLSLDTHFLSITRGVLDSRDLLYYLTFLGFFLYVNVHAVRRDRQRGVNPLLLAGILLLVNGLGARQFWRLDFTEDRRFTLHATTRRALEGLSMPLRVRAFLSSNLPSNYTNVRRDLVDFLKEMETRSDGRMTVQILDPEIDPRAVDSAAIAGIQPQRLEESGVTSAEVRICYLGLVMEHGEHVETITRLPRPEYLEYHLVRRLERMSRPRPVSVAFQMHEPLAAPGQSLTSKDLHSPRTDMQLFAKDLRIQYDTRVVDLHAPPPERVRTLILTNAMILAEAQKYHLDQFVMGGGRLLVLAEGTVQSRFGDGNRQNTSPFVRDLVESTSADLFADWGFEIGRHVLFDARCLKENRNIQGGAAQQLVDYPAYLHVLRDAMAEHPVTAGLQELILPFASAVGTGSNPEIHTTVLLQTSSKASKRSEKLLHIAPGSLHDQEVPENYDEVYNLAALLEGPFRSHFLARPIPKEVKDAWADAHPAEDQEEVGEDVWRQRLGFLDQAPPDSQILVVGSSEVATDRYVRAFPDTHGLVMNAVQYLSSDWDLASLRTRRNQARPFADPAPTQRVVGTFFGMYLVPLLISLAALVRWLWRPAGTAASPDEPDPEA